MLIAVRDFSSVSELLAFNKRNHQKLMKPKVQPTQKIEIEEEFQAASHRKSFETICNIKSVCCDVFEVSHEELIGDDRTVRCVVPRHVAISLSRRMTGRSLSYIAKWFSGRDHTAIRHAFHKTKQVLDEIESSVPSNATLYHKITLAKQMIDERGIYKPRALVAPRPVRKFAREILVEVEGVTLNITEWAKKNKIPRKLIMRRIREYKWPPAEAVTMPRFVVPTINEKTVVEVAGEFKTIAEWARKNYIPKKLIIRRIRYYGWLPSAAVTQEKGALNPNGTYKPMVPERINPCPDFSTGKSDESLTQP